MGLRRTLGGVWLLAAVLAWATYRFEATRSREERVRRLVPVALNNISRVQVEKPGGSFDLARADGGVWVVASLRRAPTAPGGVPRFLDALSRVLLSGPVAKGDIPSQFGVNPMVGVITVSGSGIDRRCVFGGEIPYLKERYLACQDSSPGSPVRLFTVTEQTAQGVLSLDYRRFWDARLLPIEPRSVRAIGCRDGGRVERKDDGSWQVSGRPADERKIEDFLRQLGSLKGERLIETGDVAPQPRGTLHLEMVENGRGELSWFAAEGGRTLALQSSFQPGLVAVTPAAWRLVTVACASFLDRTLTAFAAEMVRTATFRTRRGNSLVINRLDGDRWAVDGEPGHPLFVRELFKELGRLEVVSLVEAGPAGFDAEVPILRVDIGLAGAGSAPGEKVVLEFWESGAGAAQGSAGSTAAILVRSSQRAQLGLLSAERFKRLVPRAEALRE